MDRSPSWIPTPCGHRSTFKTEESSAANKSSPNASFSYICSNLHASHQSRWQGENACVMIMLFHHLDLLDSRWFIENSGRFMEDIPVVIVCGGQGTRMRGSTATKKELVEIGGRPILWHVMRFFSTYGYHRFVLTLGYGADQIRRYFLEYEAMSRDLTVCLGQPANGRSPIQFHRVAPHLPWQGHPGGHRPAHGKSRPHRPRRRIPGRGPLFCGLWRRRQRRRPADPGPLSPGTW